MADSRFHRLRIRLLACTPEIWRTVDVDSTMRLDELHDAIQITIGWMGSHLHQFHNIPPLAHTAEPPPRFWSDPRFELECFDDTEVLDQRQTTVASALADGNPLYYEYDFGDGWLHQIELLEEGIATPGEPRASVIGGEIHGPLEDSGGPHGYQRMLEILADQSHPEHQEIAAWITGNTASVAAFDPQHIDLVETNRQLLTQLGRH